MILNNAENIMSGSSEVASVYVGTELVWSRSGPQPVNPVSNFTLDVTRFDAAAPSVYDTNGNVIGEVISIGGSIDTVHTTQDGIEVAGKTSMRIPVNLPKNQSWTIMYNIKSFNNSGNIAFVFDSTGENLETAKVSSTDYIRHRFGSSKLGGTYTLYNNTVTFNETGVEIGICDYATRTTEMTYYNMCYMWVCNGHTLSLYVNGAKKIETSLESFPDNVTEIGIPNYNNRASSTTNNTRMVVTKFQVANTALSTLSHVLYRWDLLGFRGSNQYFQFARLCLYADGIRLDENAGAVAACWVDGDPPTYPNNSQTVAQITGDRTGKICARRGVTQNIVFSIPSDLDPVDQYSYFAASDEATRDPIDWELYKSVDGGVTWRLLDIQTNVPDPGRDQETDIFPIEYPEPPDPPTPDPDPIIPGETESKATGTPPITFPSDGDNLLDWEIQGAEDSTTGVAVGIPYTNLFYGHQWENCYRSPQGYNVIIGDQYVDEKIQRNYYVSTYDVIPVEPETEYTLAFYNGSVPDYRYFYFIYFDNTVSNLVEPTQVPEGERNPNIGYTSLYLGINGKSYGTITTPARTAYMRICVGNTSESSINTANIGDTMLNKGKYPFPYIADDSTKYAVPVVVTSGNDTYYYVFSLTAPLSTGDVISKTSTGVNIPTYSGTNVLTVDTPTLPQIYIKYKNGGSGST